MLHAACHCGAVRLDVRREPRVLAECNWSICRRYAARWASRHCAPYTAKTGTFLYHFCRRCGCVTHYMRVNTANDERTVINTRMMEQEDVAAVPVRTLDTQKHK